MKDTSPEMEARHRALIMERTSRERLAMASSMFDLARRLATTSIQAANPAISEVGLRQALFLRFYGHEFGPEERDRILTHIVAAWERSRTEGDAALGS